jgi:transcriptional regulator with XRE-family HTH domain
MIIPERLRRLREKGRLSRESLAIKACLTPKTIYRLEKGDEPKPIRQANLDRLAQALDVDPDILTGKKNLDASEPSTPTDVTFCQLHVRVDAAVRNSFELAARHYGVSVSKIAKLAPLLFVILAEASLKHHRKQLDKLLDLRERISEIEDNFPDFAQGSYHFDEGVIDNVEEEIKNRDLFGLHELFATFLSAETEGSDEIAIQALGPTSTDYEVCRSEAIGLAGGDEEVAGWLVSGEVLIHRIRGDLKNNAERVQWMREHRKSAHREPEELPKEFPGDLVFDLDVDALLAKQVGP